MYSVRIGCNEYRELHSDTQLEQGGRGMNESGTAEQTGLLGWIRAYAFTGAILIALPFLYLVLTTAISNISPDGMVNPTAACQSDTTDAKAKLKALECRLPTLQSLPMSFAWTKAETTGAEKSAKSGRTLPQIVADDVKARYGFAIPVSLLILFSVPTLGIIICGLWRTGGRFWVAAGLMAAAAAGVTSLFYQDTHPIRLYVANLLLRRAAEDSSYPFLTVGTWDWMTDILTLSTAATLAACAGLLILFARLAVRTAPAELNRSRLIERARWFRATVLIGSLILALGVAAAYGLMHWAPALVPADQREPLSALASSAGLYWGMMYSLALLLFAMPAVAALHLDIARFETALDADLEEKANRKPLIEEAGLNLNIKHSISTVLTLAAPALTGPALDLLNKLSNL